MKILELKNGSVDVNNIDTYNELQKKLNFIRKRLDCVTSPLFRCKYFKLGDYRCPSHLKKSPLAKNCQRGF